MLTRILAKIQTLYQQINLPLENNPYFQIQLEDLEYVSLSQLRIIFLR